MHSKSCCALFLLALIACQAAPSSKILEEKSISETETKFTKDLTPEETGANKDRAKKSTTFCVKVRSGREELVPCSPQEINKLPNVNVKNPNQKPSANNNVQPGSDPISIVQYPSVSNVVLQPPQFSPNTVQQPSNVFVQPNFVQVPVQTQPPQSSVVHSASISQVQSQPVVPSFAPTPIINVIPAPLFAPGEKPSVPLQLAPQPLKPAPKQLNNPLWRPLPRPWPTFPNSYPRPRPRPKPQKPKSEQWPAITRLEKTLIPVVRPSYTSEVLFTLNTPVEYIYHRGYNNNDEDSSGVSHQYQQGSDKCSCQSEQQKTNNQVEFYPNSELRSSMIAAQYDPNIVGSEDELSAFAAQAREAMSTELIKIKQ